MKRSRTAQRVAVTASGRPLATTYDVDAYGFPISSNPVAAPARGAIVRRVSVALRPPTAYPAWDRSDPLSQEAAWTRATS